MQMRLLKWQLIRSKQQSNERHKMKNIIIAEDEFVIRLSITDKLQRLGYTAHATENGAQALQMILDIRLLRRRQNARGING